MVLCTIYWCAPTGDELTRKMKNLAGTFFGIFCMILVLTTSCLAGIFPDNHHHHQHNHHQSTITKRGIQRENSSDEIPLDLIFKLNNIQNISELSNFLSEDSLDPADTMSGGTDVKTGDGDDDDGTRNRKPLTFPEHASCTPELTTVPLTKPGHPTNVYFLQSCTRVKRCGGCCNNEYQSCQPTKKELLDFKIMPLKYVGNEKFEYKNYQTVSVEQHLKCKCDCKVKPTDCTVFQVYRKGECRCVCKNLDDKRKCNEENNIKEWDSQNCKCSCRNKNKICSTGLSFSEETCSCK